MTRPTITYGHELLDNCTSIAGWQEHFSGMLATDATLTVVDDDLFRIEAVVDDAGNEYCYYQYPTAGSPLSIDTDTYKKLLVRWKTNVASNGVGARVMVWYDAAWHYAAVGVDYPEFNIGWKVSSADLPPNKTIEYVAFVADDYPDDCPSDTYYVYFDFILLHKDTFTIPATDAIHLRFRNQFVDLSPLERVGEISQNLGATSPEITLTGTVKSNTGWGSPLLEKLYDIYFNAHQEPWQWFTSDLINCKVTIRDFDASQMGASSQRKWELRLKKFDYHCGSKDWVWDYYGFEI